MKYTRAREEIEVIPPTDGSLTLSSLRSTFGSKVKIFHSGLPHSTFCEPNESVVARFHELVHTGCIPEVFESLGGAFFTEAQVVKFIEARFNWICESELNIFLPLKIENVECAVMLYYDDFWDFVVIGVHITGKYQVGKRPLYIEIPYIFVVPEPSQQNPRFKIQ